VLVASIALATDRKTPLSEAAPPAPGRSQKTAERSKVARRRAIIGGAAAVVVIGVGAYLLSGGEVPGPVGNIINPGPDTPTFAFDKDPKVTVIATTDTPTKDLQDAADKGAAEVQAVLTDYLQGAFVEPGDWGDYDGVFQDAMTKDAAAEAAEKADELTLGADANDVYDFVQPEHGKLQVTVLTGAEDAPVQASAVVTFVADTDLKDGTHSRVRSTGTYLLRQVDGHWKIFSFDAQRKEVKIQTSPTATASAGASTEPSA
jgi:hypothetical protein